MRPIALICVFVFWNAAIGIPIILLGWNSFGLSFLVTIGLLGVLMLAARSSSTLQGVLFRPIQPSDLSSMRRSLLFFAMFCLTFPLLAILIGAFR